MAGKNAPEGDGFAALLREYRVAANLTQDQLAERSGLSSQAIAKLERGERRSPRPTTLEWLAGALKLDARRRDAFIAAARGRRSPAALSGEAPLEGQPLEPRAGVPPVPVAHFLGREAELAEIERRLGEVGRLAVHGLGGIGKTQLVAHYVHRHRAEYTDGVFWLRADEESSLVGDLASLAWRLGLPERERAEQERQVEAVLRWLTAHPCWLLVLDNVEVTTQEAVGRWLLPGLSGHLLVTSRTPMWSVKLGLEPLPLELATRFLLRRAGLTDPAAARGVAEALGGLPLALEQAAAYLEVSGRDMASYAELLRTRLVELMAEGRPEDYPRPVASTWQLSFTRMESENPAAAALLRLCAFMAPDGIPIGTLRAGADVVPSELRPMLADDLAFDRGIMALKRYSLLERQGDLLRVHRLVQAVVRESLDLDQWRTWLAAAIRLLAIWFPGDVQYDTERWPLCTRLLPHAQVVDQLAADQTVEPRPLSDLLDRVATYLWARGDFRLARPFFERALAIRERVLSLDDPDIAASLNNLALPLAQNGELDRARPLMERALAIREVALGPEHLDTATSFGNLAYLLRAQDEPALARPFSERALAIRERRLGPDHPYVAISHGNLGRVLQEQGDLPAARLHFERALAIRERVLGPDHVYTAESLSDLGQLLHLQGEIARAGDLLRRALAIAEQILGLDHRQTARSMYYLAMVLRSGGELEEALSLTEDALAVQMRVPGPEHRWTVESQRLLQDIAGELQARSGGPGA